MNYDLNYEDGDFEIFFQNGQLKEKGIVKNGVLDGIWESYYENGQLEIKTTYIKGKNNGLYTSYFENGQIKFETIYINNIRQNYYKWYDMNGNLIEENCTKTKVLRGKSTSQNNGQKYCLNFYISLILP